VVQVAAVTEQMATPTGAMAQTTQAVVVALVVRLMALLHLIQAAQAAPVL
jgi:hypothetical protein